MDEMNMFKSIADIAESVLWVCFLWEMIQAVKYFAEPDPDGIERILWTLQKIRVCVEGISDTMGIRSETTRKLRDEKSSLLGKIENGKKND